MSQKSSLPQAAKSVSRVLVSDTYGRMPRLSLACGLLMVAPTLTVAGLLPFTMIVGGSLSIPALLVVVGEAAGAPVLTARPGAPALAIAAS